MLSGPVAAVSDGTMQMDAVDPKAAAEVEGATSEFAKVDGAVNVVVKLSSEQGASTLSASKLEADPAAFAAAFDHRKVEGKAVCAKLFPEEVEALMLYRQANGLKEKGSWSVSEIPESSGTEKQTLYSFREKLISHKVINTEEACQFCTDFVMLRYLRARNMNMEKAEGMLSQTIKWRVTTRPREMRNDATAHSPDLTDVRIIGMDDRHRPVIFQSYPASADHSAASLQKNSICVMEKAMQCMSAHAPHSVVFVYDLGASRKDGLSSIKDQARVAGAVKKVAKIFQDHYPEMLALMVFINPPGVYEAAYQMVRPFIDAKTAAKVMVLHDSDMMPKLKTAVGERMASVIFSASH